MIIILFHNDSVKGIAKSFLPQRLVGFFISLLSISFSTFFALLIDWLVLQHFVQILLSSSESRSYHAKTRPRGQILAERNFDLLARKHPLHIWACFAMCRLVSAEQRIIFSTDNTWFVQHIKKGPQFAVIYDLSFDSRLWPTYGYP